MTHGVDNQQGGNNTIIYDSEMEIVIQPTCSTAFVLKAQTDKDFGCDKGAVRSDRFSYRA